MKNTLKTLFISFIMSISLNSYSQYNDDDVYIKKTNENTANYQQVITKQVVGQIDSYTTKFGETFKIGDTITLGVPFRNENFDNIMQEFGLNFYPLPSNASHSIVKIKKIYARNKVVYIYTTKAQGYIYGLVITNLESSIENGEIKSSILTSDQALEELKKWKSKYDLELITEDEYNKKKVELSKFIK